MTDLTLLRDPQQLISHKVLENEHTLFVNVTNIELCGNRIEVLDHLRYLIRLCKDLIILLYLPDILSQNIDGVGIPLLLVLDEELKFREAPEQPVTVVLLSYLAFDLV